MVFPNVIVDYFILIRAPDHPQNQNGYVPEQILIAEKNLGRYLTPDEEVRHINGRAQDNRPANLEIVSTSSSYKSSSLIGDDDASHRANSKNFIPCKFQKPCWKEIRAPIARKNKVFLPYICSFQQEGDIYACSRFWSFLEKEQSAKETE